MSQATTFRRMRFLLRVLGSLALFVPQVASVHAQEYSFSTLAGGRLGDGGSATHAHVNSPAGVVLDANGTIYVAEYFGHRVRKVGTDSVIHTVAGNGVAGFSGDGGSATSAKFNSPEGLIIDAAGALYVADANNNRVRKIGLDGVIHTVAGNGSATSSGDGGSALAAGISHPFGLAFDGAGNLYVSEMFGHRIRKIGTDGSISTFAGTGTAGAGGDGGPAVSAQLAQPAGLGFDAVGNLYVADSSNSRIRKITAEGIISTVAVDGATLYVPLGLAVSPAGDLYIGDACVLLKVNALGIATQLAGGDWQCIYNGDGSASTANIDYMDGLALGPTGQLYVSDSGNHRVRRIVDGTIATIAGVGSYVDGDQSQAVFSTLYGVATSSTGDVFVADAVVNGRIRKISQQGQVSTVAGTERTSGIIIEGGPATDTILPFPTDVALDGAGRLYIADRVWNRVLRVDVHGVITTVAGSDNIYLGDGVPATQANLRGLRSVAVTADGVFYVTDHNHHRIRRIGTDGIITTVAGTGVPGFSGDGGLATNAMLNSPQSLALDDAGNLYIADSGNLRIRKVAPNGVISTYAGDGTFGMGGLGGPAIQAQLERPIGLAADALGRLFIAGGSLRVVRADGTLQLVGGLGYPAEDVAIGSDGSLYVTVLGGRVLRGTPQPLTGAKAPRAPAPTLPPLSNRK
jgi:sugar lactone lactonase YvrE